VLNAPDALPMSAIGTALITALVSGGNGQPRQTGALQRHPDDDERALTHPVGQHTGARCQQQRGDAAAERAVVDEFADAFQDGDVPRVVALLTDDAWLTMPPLPLEYQGP
jgi:hypothetical protein